MKKGFTLLELLMVVIIVGVLAALALPQYTAFVERSRGSEAVNVIGAIKAAENVYYVENTNYSANIAGIGVTVPTGAQALWTYGVGGVSAAGYTITATRTTVAGGNNTHTITFTWTSATGTGIWGGTFPGRPT